MFLNDVCWLWVSWRSVLPEEQKQILRDAYPIAHGCAKGPQACVIQDDRDLWRELMCGAAKAMSCSNRYEGVFFADGTDSRYVRGYGKLQGIHGYRTGEFG
jgi:hypothetical protein